MNVVLLMLKGAVYIYKDSKLLASLMQWYICFLPSWSGAEIKCTVHVTQTVYKLVKLAQQSRQALRAYCPNIYTVTTIVYHTKRKLSVHV